MSAEHKHEAEVNFYGTKFRNMPPGDIQLHLMGVIAGVKAGVKAGKTLDQILAEDINATTGSEAYDDAYKQVKAIIEKAIEFYRENIITYE